MHVRTRPSTACDRCSCGSTVTCPMLLDEIWGVISNGDRFLCWPCAEKRLGREIKIEDLGVCYEKPRYWTMEHGRRVLKEGERPIFVKGHKLNDMPRDALATLWMELEQQRMKLDADRRPIAVARLRRLRKDQGKITAMIRQRGE